MLSGNRFTCPETGFAITKPARWSFVPGPWMMPEREALAATEERRELLRSGSVPIVAFAYTHESIYDVNPTVQVFRRPFDGAGDLDELAAAVQSALPGLLARCVFREVTSAAMLAGRRALRYVVEYSICGEEPGVSLRCRMLGHSFLLTSHVLTVSMATSTRKAYRFEPELQQVLDSIRFSH